MGELNIIIITTVTGIITTLLTTIVGIYRENRNRRWDLQDRENARRELEGKVLGQQQSIEFKTNEQTKVLTNLINENTNISANAFKEANGLNLKLVELSHRFDSMPISRRVIEELPDPEVVNKISEIVEDTNSRVRGLEHADSQT